MGYKKNIHQLEKVAVNGDHEHSAGDGLHFNCKGVTDYFTRLVIPLRKQQNLDYVIADSQLALITGWLAERSF